MGKEGESAGVKLVNNNKNIWNIWSGPGNISYPPERDQRPGMFPGPYLLAGDGTTVNFLCLP